MCEKGETCQKKIQQKQEIIYSVPISPSKDGQTSIYRKLSHKDGLFSIPAQFTQLADLWDQRVSAWGQKKVLEDLTYRQVNEIAYKLGSWIFEMGHHKFYLYCKNSVHWTVTDIATWLYGLTNVPLYDTLGSEGVEYILQLTEGTLIFTTSNMLCKLKTLLQANFHCIKSICFYDEISEGQKNQLEPFGVEVFSFQQILKKQNILEKPQSTLQKQCSIVFTSGTTGRPKGVVYTHKMVMTQILAARDEVKMDEEELHMSFLPLAHAFQRSAVWIMIINGGRIRYARHSTQELMLDYQEIKPTRAVLVPRLLNRIYPTIKALYEETGSYEPARQIFGGRIKRVGVGSAALAPQILQFFKTALNCPFTEGFGQTQTTGSSLRMSQEDDVSGHVGGPTCAVQIKLIDVPEMGYLSTNLIPSGELCIRGDTVFTHYFKDPVSTRQVLDEDGWNHTGDIAMILSNGSVKIIDRKKSLFKLQQGEYLSPEKLQAIYNRCPEISECFVHGESLQNYAVAIVHPNIQRLAIIAKELGLQEQDPLNLCQNQAVVSRIFQEMSKEAEKAKLFGFQKVKKIKLHPTSLSVLGLFTSTMKIKRHLARDYFSKAIQELYS